MRFFMFAIGCIMCCLACQQPEPNTSGWKKVYANDGNGKKLYGEKSDLIEAVRLGYPVRIGWGSSRVEHVAEAPFLTVFEGEVFAQIATIIGQRPMTDNDSIRIRFRAENHWTKIAGTNGYTTAFMTNYLKDSIVGGNTDRYGATTWYVEYPAGDSAIDPRPLWREDSPNWQSWNSNQ